MEFADIKTIEVIGSGIMGGGIAQVAAAAGFNVILCDIDQKTAERGRALYISNIKIV